MAGSGNDITHPTAHVIANFKMHNLSNIFSCEASGIGQQTEFNNYWARREDSRSPKLQKQ